MKTVLMIAFGFIAMSLATPAGAQAADSKKAAVGAKALLKFLKADPAVRGGLVNISKSKSLYKHCEPLKVEINDDGTFQATATCSGSDGQSESEWAQFMTVTGNIWGKGVFFVKKIEFDLAG